MSDKEFTPSYFYNDKGDRKLVTSADDVTALGKGWHESPKKAGPEAAAKAKARFDSPESAKEYARHQKAVKTAGAE